MNPLFSPVSAALKMITALYGQGLINLETYHRILTRYA